jgi:hypothetical protein
MGGCMSVDAGADGPGGGFGGGYHGSGYGGHGPAGFAGGAPPAVPGMQGPWGQSVPMAPPYSTNPPGAIAARQMLATSVPLDIVQMAGGAAPMPGAPPGGALPGMIMPAGGLLSPPGVPAAPGMPAGGGGVMQANLPPGSAPGGLVQAAFGQVAAVAPIVNGPRFSIQRTQVQFRKPANMEVSWYSETPDGKSGYFEKLQTPGRYNFLQAAVYRLKLSKIKDRPLLELYPTLEVVPTNSKTEAFLAHSAVPVEFTDEDFKQIAEGNYVIKVIYLPDPQYQELAGTGTEEILSTRLEPGADPIQEALRRGSILLVIRMGNIFQELNNTPPMNAPGPRGVLAPMPPPPGTPGTMVPYFGMGGGGPLAPGMMPPAGPGGAMIPPNAMAGQRPMMPPQAPNGFGPMFGPNGAPTPMGPMGPMPPSGNFAGPGGLPPGFAPPPGYPGNNAGQVPGDIRTVPPVLPNTPNPGFGPGGPPLPPNAIPGIPGVGGPSSRGPQTTTTQQTSTLPPADSTIK